MQTNIYLVRHGQSEGNLTHAFLGHTDLPLTALGHTQAEVASEYLCTLSPDRIYSSDLLRAYQTAEPTAKKCNLTIETSEDLREIFAGQWEALTFSTIESDFQEDYRVWHEDIGFARPTDGESVQELFARIHDALVSIAKENEGKTVMIFLHATPIRSFSAIHSGLGFEGMKNLPWATNASVTHLVYEGDTFSLLEYGRDDYLGSLSTKLPKNV